MAGAKVSTFKLHCRANSCLILSREPRCWSWFNIFVTPPSRIITQKKKKKKIKIVSFTVEWRCNNLFNMLLTAFFAKMYLSRPCRPSRWRHVTFGYSRVTPQLTWRCLNGCREFLVSTKKRRKKKKHGFENKRERKFLCVSEEDSRGKANFQKHQTPLFSRPLTASRISCPGFLPFCSCVHFTLQCQRHHIVLELWPSGLFTSLLLCFWYLFFLLMYN